MWIANHNRRGRVVIVRGGGGGNCPGGSCPRIHLLFTSSVVKWLLNRFKDDLFLLIVLFSGSIIWERDPAWKKNRRLGFQALRCFGVGKTSMENRVLAECEVLTDYLRKHTGLNINPEVALSNVVANITCRYVGWTQLPSCSKILHYENISFDKQSGVWHPCNWFTGHGKITIPNLRY